MRNHHFRFIYLPGLVVKNYKRRKPQREPKQKEDNNEEEREDGLHRRSPNDEPKRGQDRLHRRRSPNDEPKEDKNAGTPRQQTDVEHIEKHHLTLSIC